LLPDVSVLIPCHNEELTIADVVVDFRTVLPTCRAYHYDKIPQTTLWCAPARPGIVRNERLQGKGNVARRMFSDISADVYLMADGDGTYDPKIARDLIRLLSYDSV